MKYDLGDIVQRGRSFAIVDEVDSILIDEARTPLIISGPTNDNSKLYDEINRLIPKLGEGDFQIEEKDRGVFLTDIGTENIEKMLKMRPCRSHLKDESPTFKAIFQGKIPAL